MSEIAKMYENANAYKNICKCYFKNIFDYSIDYGQDVCIHVEDEIRHGCEGCELAEQNVKYYPPFTAEKQLELIKWLIQKYKTILIEHKLNLFYINIRAIYTGMVHIEFDETIAGLFNNLWQDLTEQERTEIAEILK